MPEVYLLLNCVLMENATLLLRHAQRLPAKHKLLIFNALLRSLSSKIIECCTLYLSEQKKKKQARRRNRSLRRTSQLEIYLGIPVRGYPSSLSATNFFDVRRVTYRIVSIKKGPKGLARMFPLNFKYCECM